MTHLRGFLKKMKKFITFFIFLTVLIPVINFSSAYCQTRYSLHDLAVMADRQSENIKIAQEDVLIARLEKKRAVSVLIPRATVYGAATRYKEPDMAMPDTFTTGGKLTYSFTLNGKELIAYDVTKKDIEAKQHSLESVRAQYLLEVVKSYYNILSAQKFYEIAQADLERLKKHREAVEEKLAVGNVTRTDLYRAQAEVSKAETEVVRSENSILMAKAALKNLVDVEDEFELTADNVFEDRNFSIEEIRDAALQNRHEIREARKNAEIAEQTIKFKKSDYWPSVSLEAGYKETDIKYDYLPRDMKYDTEDLYVSGELVFTLYDGGLRRAQIRQAVSGYNKAKHALTLAEKKILLESKTAFLENQTAKTVLLNLEDELKSATETFNAVNMQFKYGMADSIDIMDANTLLVSAQRRISDAQYNYGLSVLKVFYTKGELTGFLLN